MVPGIYRGIARLIMITSTYPAEFLQLVIIRGERKRQKK